MKLEILKESFSIHRLDTNENVSKELLKGSFYSITKTDDELSIVCDSSIALQSEKTEKGWSCIKIVGPLDFSLTGILAKISNVLAKEEISIFSISTYDTDYILIKSDQLGLAKSVLSQSGYEFT